ncbi:MAG: hypothetical protein IT330_14625 [Anaerolineae bacterium]|nr:hypothetical protein [Anaerolineae bacterium]
MPTTPTTPAFTLRGWGLCNYIPNLYVWFDVPDVTAAIAPRPLLCNNEIGRGGVGLEPLRTNFTRVQRVYDALGAGDRCELYAFPAPYHVFSGERAYPWLAQWL